MPYTVWSRGRLIGQSELGFARVFPDMRTGEFDATDVGERLMPVILGVGPALNAFYDLAIDARDQALEKAEPLGQDDWPDSVRSTTEYADAKASQDEFDALCLELHDNQGNVVKTDWITLRDVERLAALGRELMRQDAEELGLDIDLDSDDQNPWDPEPAKYQITVMLEGGEERARRAARERRKKLREAGLDGL